MAQLSGLTNALFAAIKDADRDRKMGLREIAREEEISASIATELFDAGYPIGEGKYPQVVVPSDGSPRCDIFVNCDVGPAWIELKTYFTQQYKHDWITPKPNTKGSSRKFAKELVSKDCVRLSSLRPSDAAAIGALLLICEDSNHPADDIFVAKHFRIPLAGWTCHNERWLSKTIKGRQFFVQAWYWWKLVGIAPSTVAP